VRIDGLADAAKYVDRNVTTEPESIVVEARSASL